MLTQPDLDEARRQHAALREIFYRADRSLDVQLVRRVEALCRRASAAVDDAYCQQEMRLVAGYAAELFSEQGHHKYESQSLSGAEFLRLQIIKALDSFHGRLFSLEAMRRAAAMGVKPEGRA
jgi:hypothetical protein